MNDGKETQHWSGFINEGNNNVNKSFNLLI